ncbi:MAG TPA: hypothetical protein VFH14_02950 [Gemmatimonadaceae bacterium]|nr:hypothetical protein [Gemmatimonadaceae bacterium]
MAFSLRRWRPRHLLLAWVTYWVLALLFALRSAIASIWRVTTDPDAHGSISAGITDGILTLTVSEGARVVWEGSASVMSIVLWVAGPPLLLFLLWLAVRPRAGEPVLSGTPQR